MRGFNEVKRRWLGLVEKERATENEIIEGSG